MGNALLEWMEENSGNRKWTLRCSNLGKKDRLLWFESRDTSVQRTDPQLRLRFLMGHLLEALLIFFIKEAGYNVTDEQAEIEILGIKGHMDLRISGIPVDIKSASNYAFTKKFTSIEALKANDDYGYIGQLSSYMTPNNDPVGYFFVVNKNSTELTLIEMDEWDTIDIKKRITYLKKALKKDTPPKEKCYEPIKEDNGNKRLDKQCEWCVPRS